MNFNLVTATSTSASFEIENNKCFYLESTADVYMNNERILTTDKNVFTLNNLTPGTEYSIFIEDTESKAKSPVISIKTKLESAVVNILDFGAVGDGNHVNTAFIQAAIQVCPAFGRVIIPKGTYLTGPLFLKSNITLELEEGSVLLGLKEREHYPILKANISMTNRDFYLGSWEGNEADCFASLITAINVENVNIIGKGTIDGNSDFDTWWFKAKEKRIAWRPRTLFLNACKNILVEGVTIKNSPSWTIHPLMSDHLKFINLSIENPFNAPNTDALDPESCKNVLILGDTFSVGDDCIAIKSGKIDISKKNPVSSENINIRNCNMRSGHGAVVLGSEMSSGLKSIFIEKCIFNATDRGLRIKTRRGRGSKGIIDNIHMKNIKMDKVLTPFSINSFYFCDDDGKTEYVWSKEKLPVDDKTPYIGSIYVEDVTCTNAHVCAAFMYGLPEQKIEKVSMKNVSVSFDENAKEDYADMMSFLEPMKRNGMYFNNIKDLVLENVTVEKALNEEITKLNIG
ncbi:polygalacturonase [Clostridium acetobutylicum]|uniref:Polygalacturonase (Pectinase) n=1 Tax=Clostridium acetobutylicum (strain ATCC 824 / DSM 792 / JCM 1419 / IAM 19013 / LMG 5710 / NBRC 13948 / NRRL B-527 / VKM B-1787 / 2291 / W) TaxID=272562 RepID=Q97M45_CLOAB|nr:MULTISPECIES: glycoside hydrolase family 28 protein [Clostridium]AAK78335.1 Putative polygalacturonase (pectinase) [Clostridium acetobutylicum ATCC 824]ADZ19404.1 Putative polygalacturonase (pectinase) [Clostridium acetobutylicum EA 2018]AEI33761.1 putative polygalacturonase (pectinase) [Clostridium acetobutylicum DSM 1731]AWV80060.1 glycoside hydrolase family 28 protein [Clostridium acetobutylicum]MBC2395881.1 glycoside hydrolase family 28 protein [Clostridium acetobutylicum]